MKNLFNGYVIAGGAVLSVVVSTIAMVGVRSYDFAFNDDRVDLDLKSECSVTALLNQDRFSLSLKSHLKDLANEDTATLPMACDDAKDMKRGDQIFDAFRWGSLFFEQSTSHWDIKALKSNAKGQDQCRVGIIPKTRSY